MLLNEDQIALRDVARRFSREKLKPHYQAREAEKGFDRALMKEIGALGLIRPWISRGSKRGGRLGCLVQRGLGGSPSSRTISRVSASAWRSSWAMWSVTPLRLQCICAPPSDSASTVSPVAAKVSSARR